MTRPVLIQVDGCAPIPFVDFYEANIESLSHETMTRVAMLAYGESLALGQCDVVRAVDPGEVERVAERFACCLAGAL